MILHLPLWKQVNIFWITKKKNTITSYEYTHVVFKKAVILGTTCKLQIPNSLQLELYSHVYLVL